MERWRGSGRSRCGFDGKEESHTDGNTAVHAEDGNARGMAKPTTTTQGNADVHDHGDDGNTATRSTRTETQMAAA
jgi:hypothetical protein